MDLKSRIEDVYEKVERACARSGRNPREITLVAVSKKFGVDKIQEAYDLGLRNFGENYAQEFRDKYDEINEECCRDIKWHFIGTLQSNKVKYVVGKTSLIHTLDSVKTAWELDKKAERLGVKVASLIEVNISGEKSKNGIKLNELKPVLNSLNQLKNVNILGLMGMAPYFVNEEKTRPY
ncbi:MAG: YggS family pyridoxal phosphate-dependent enzyme, partial [Thermodesulfobacteriota bacterium]